MSARTTRHRRHRMPRATFQRAHAPLRRTWQGRYTRDYREPLLAQLALTAEDLPPLQVLRGRHYRVADLPAEWHPNLAWMLGLVVAFVILQGVYR